MLALVVDDEPDIVRLLEISLAKDFEVITAQRGSDAIAIARSRRPNVILVDRRLPDGDGIQLLSALRHDENTAKIPIIVITALTPTDLPPGIAGFIQKPFDPIELPGRIRAILEGRS
jgi:DNA-binding response OmpR family regulator